MQFIKDCMSSWQKLLQTYVRTSVHFTLRLPETKHSQFKDDNKQDKVIIYTMNTCM